MDGNRAPLGSVKEAIQNRGVCLNSLRYLSGVGVSAVSDFAAILTAGRQRTPG
jgi:hypothetical protein